MGDLAKTGGHGCPHRVKFGGLGCEVGKSLCQRAILALFRVVVGIADFRRIFLVIGQISGAQLFLQLLKQRAGLFQSERLGIHIAWQCHVRRLFLVFA